LYGKIFGDKIVSSFIGDEYDTHILIHICSRQPYTKMLSIRLDQNPVSICQM